MTFLGCSAVCRACVRAKPRRCQGQRGFGWYLNFKATLGALPISHATRRAHPSLLAHHHPSQLLRVTQARFMCCTAGKANKIRAFPSLLAGTLAPWLFSKVWIVSAIKKKKSGKGSWRGQGPLWPKKASELIFLWSYITRRVLYPCESLPNLEMGTLTRERNPSST